MAFISVHYRSSNRISQFLWACGEHRKQSHDLKWYISWLKSSKSRRSTSNVRGLATLTITMTNDLHITAANTDTAYNLFEKVNKPSFYLNMYIYIYSSGEGKVKRHRKFMCKTASKRDTLSKSSMHKTMS